MINWNLVHNALFNWVVYLSGYAADKVIWKSQDGDTPTGDYLTIGLGDHLHIGFDAQTQEYDPMAPAGQELTVTVSGDRELAVVVESYSGATVDSTDARSILAMMLTRSSLPRAQAILDDVGLSHFDRGQATYLPAIKEIKFEGRGLWENRMYIRDSASEKSTYIQSVELTNTATGDVVEIDT